MKVSYRQAASDDVVRQFRYYLVTMDVPAVAVRFRSADEIIARLRENKAALRKRGVAHAALFGSRARADHAPESDTDIMIEFDPASRITVFNYAGLRDYIAALFDGRVDVVNRDALRPYVSPAATTGATMPSDAAALFCRFATA